MPAIQNRFRRRGFTIIELIVAVSVSMIMMFLINQLFFETSRAVSLGVAVSDVIATARAMNTQLDKDTSAMLAPVNGPTGGGVLVIINEKKTVPYKDHKGAIQNREVRMDQVYWIRGLAASANGMGEMPISPRGTDTYSSATRAQVATTEAIRVWYGHVLKTNADGTSPGTFGDANTPNQFANEFALGRHALFLVSNNADVAGIGHSAGAIATAPVSVVGSGQLSQGYTDVASYDYTAKTIGGNPNGAFVGAIQSAGGGGAATLWSLTSPGVANSQLNYSDMALTYAFDDANPLLGNPAPEVLAANPLPSSLVAQMHTIFANRVSDFIVEFAADTDYDGQLDLDGNDVKWYGLDNPPTWSGLPAHSAGPGPPPNKGASSFVFRHDYPAHWPKMLRIRYRVHDKRCQLLGDMWPAVNGTNNGKWFEQIIEVATSQ
jgi:type II secretory pathway pseudopilin PulG